MELDIAENDISICTIPDVHRPFLSIAGIEIEVDPKRIHHCWLEALWENEKAEAFDIRERVFEKYKALGLGCVMKMYAAMSAHDKVQFLVTLKEHRTESEKEIREIQDKIDAYIRARAV